MENISLFDVCEEQVSVLKGGLSVFLWQDHLYMCLWIRGLDHRAQESLNLFFPPCSSSTIVLFVTPQWSSLRCHDKIQQPLTESCTFFNPGQGPKVKIAPEKLQKHLILSKCYETSK